MRARARGGRVDRGGKSEEGKGPSKSHRDAPAETAGMQDSHKRRSLWEGWSRKPP